MYNTELTVEKLGGGVDIMCVDPVMAMIAAALAALAGVVLFVRRRLTEKER